MGVRYAYLVILKQSLVIVDCFSSELKAQQFIDTHENTNIFRIKHMAIK